MPDDSFLAGRATEKVALDASVLSAVHCQPTNVYGRQNRFPALARRTVSQSSQCSILRPTTAYGTTIFEMWLGQPFYPPRPLNSCSVMHWRGGTEGASRWTRVDR